MNRQIFSPDEPGIRKTLKEWEELALRHVWDSGEGGASSSEVWRAVNVTLSKSRASIFFFLEDMVELSILGYTMESGKGGWHRRYTPHLDERGYIKHMIKSNLESALRDFPEEATEIIKSYR